MQQSKSTPLKNAQRSIRALLLLVCSAFALGCASGEKWIQRRPSGNGYQSYISFVGDKDPSFSVTTQQLAGEVGLDPLSDEDQRLLIGQLENRSHVEKNAEIEFALAELAAAKADKLIKQDPQLAIGYYAESIVHSYHVLEADPKHRIPGVTQHYNRSLTSILKVLQEQDLIKPGTQVELPTSHTGCTIDINFHSHRWQRKDFQSFEFANEFQVLALQNHYHTSGIGVPLIGIRNHPNRDSVQDRYYPTKLCYPLTAFARIEKNSPYNAQHIRASTDQSEDVVQQATAHVHEHHITNARSTQQPGERLILELHDPMDHDKVQLAGHVTPLETDLTTPLAYYLDQPELHEEELSTLGLLKPGSVEQLQGLYLLEPFDPNRIPVIMVHGLWSSPATWMEMFNDLRSDPMLRKRYQFWFYLYPTGTPFWVSASEMRKDMAELRQTFDPQRRYPALDQTVLVGHSMGGLVSRLQTVDSKDDFWRIVSDRPFNELKATPEARQHVSSLFYFQPNASVRRVVTIGTPHRGSRYANGFTRWLGTKLIATPMATMAKRQQIFRDNPGFFKPQAATRVITSIDSLTPGSPVLETLLSARAAPWVNYHNIVGDQPRSWYSSWYASRGDGIVSVDSARLDDLPGLQSQIIVPESHVAIHTHPQSISEVRRILHKQLHELMAAESQIAESLPPFVPQQPSKKLEVAKDKQLVLPVTYTE